MSSDSSRIIHLTDPSHDAFPLIYVSFTPEEIQGTYFEGVVNNPTMFKQVKIHNPQKEIIGVAYVINDPEITYDHMRQWRLFLDHHGDITKRKYSQKFLLFLHKIIVLDDMINTMSLKDYFLFEARNDFSEYVSVLELLKRSSAESKERYLISGTIPSTGSKGEESFDSMLIPEEFTQIYLAEDYIILYDGNKKIRIVYFKRNSGKPYQKNAIHHHLDIIFFGKDEEIIFITPIEIIIKRFYRVGTQHHQKIKIDIKGLAKYLGSSFVLPFGNIASIGYIFQHIPDAITVDYIQDEERVLKMSEYAKYETPQKLKPEGSTKISGLGDNINSAILSGPGKIYMVSPNTVSAYDDTSYALYGSYNFIGKVIFDRFPTKHTSVKKIKDVADIATFMEDGTTALFSRDISKHILLKDHTIEDIGYANITTAQKKDLQYHCVAKEIYGISEKLYEKFAHHFTFNDKAILEDDVLKSVNLFHPDSLYKGRLIDENDQVYNLYNDANISNFKDSLAVMLDRDVSYLDNNGQFVFKDGGIVRVDKDFVMKFMESTEKYFGDMWKKSDDGNIYSRLEKDLYTNTMQWTYTGPPPPVQVPPVQVPPVQVPPVQVQYAQPSSPGSPGTFGSEVVAFDLF